MTEGVTNIDIKMRDSMRVLIVYDTMYGNTERIARAVGGAIVGDVNVVRASQANPEELASIDLLVIGCPTYGGRPTPTMQEFLDKISEANIKGVKVASFDTRYTGRFVKMFGFAADKIAEGLKARGATMVAPPEAFYVTGKKGPLRDGDLERAASWAKEITR